MGGHGNGVVLLFDSSVNHVAGESVFVLDFVEMVHRFSVFLVRGPSFSLVFSGFVLQSFVFSKFHFHLRDGKQSSGICRDRSSGGQS